MRKRLAWYVHCMRKLTARRLLNFFQLWLSFHLSKALRRPLVWGAPAAIAVEPTTACNLRCPECPSGLRRFSRPTGKLSFELYRRMIDEVAPKALYLTLYFQGEPYLHPQFFELVNYAHRKGLFTITSTNGHFLDAERARHTVESGLDRLIVSIDGVTQQSYAAYRKEGQLQKVLEGIREIVAWKKKLRSLTPEVVLQFLVVRPNEHEIPAIRQLAKELGADRLVLKTAQIYDFEDGSPLIPTIERYSRYRQLPNGKYAIKNSLKNQCWRMWNGFVMTWDGRLVPCCFDKDAQHQMGQFPQQSIAAIWQSPPYRQFRQQLLHARKNIDICRNCSEGLKVWS
ncbi:radical SAM/SPASM domain-containing protein [Thermonema rossianum]|uniref:radical SAM/SPASM domain-containing protein n=1 Tax=Thermonema rossianum TaxID=55505 RepID=UPI00056EF547|nr:radical SAM/SPASM domain-containing protein [Thermonema rossianum]